MLPFQLVRDYVLSSLSCILTAQSTQKPNADYRLFQELEDRKVHAGSEYMAPLIGVSLHQEPGSLFKLRFQPKFRCNSVLNLRLCHQCTQVAQVTQT